MIIELNSNMTATVVLEEDRYEELKKAEAKLMAIQCAFNIRGIRRDEIKKLVNEVETFNLRPYNKADETLINAYVEMYIKKLRQEKGAKHGKKESK